MAGEALAERAGKQLLTELRGNRRLSERVRWAVANFSKVQPSAAPRRNGAATPPPPRARPASRRAPTPKPARPGVPSGLPPKIDLGRVAWRSDATKSFQLTWKEFAPYNISVEAPPPLTADVTASKVLPGRFSVAIGVDWTSPEFASRSRLRGYTLDAEIIVRWTSEDSVPIRVRGLLLYPPQVTASPAQLDLGTVRVNATTRASIVLASSARGEATIETPAWLRRVDAAGRPLDGPLQLAPDTEVRVALRVEWAPIIERGESSLKAGRPVRPSGTIVVTCGDQRIEIPAQMVATPK